MTGKIHLGLLCATLGAALLAGCGSIRVVNRTQTGGTIALEGDRNKAMEKANQEMSAHCRGPFTIVEEGEVAIGTDKRKRSDTDYGESTNYSEDSASGSATATDGRGNTASGSGTSTQGGSDTQGGSSTEELTTERVATEWRLKYVCGASGPPSQ